MSAPLFTCYACKTPVVLSPPLSHRTSSFGLPMTRADALHLFRHGDDGICTACMIRRRSESAKALMRKKGLESAARRAAGYYEFSPR